MTQACCHFLYPIVLNPWCRSPLILLLAIADSTSAALPILELRIIYYASCTIRLCCNNCHVQAKPRLLFLRCTFISYTLDMATAPPQGPFGHAHPHPHPPQPGQPGVRPPGMMMPPSPPPNPALQALLDAIPHVPVPFTIQDGPIPNTNPPQTTTMVLCEAHKQVICQTCGVHFGPINYMSNFLKGAPAEAIPPPPNAPTQPQRAEAIKQAKEAGNVCTL